MTLPGGFELNLLFLIKALFCLSFFFLMSPEFFFLCVLDSVSMSAWRARRRLLCVLVRARFPPFLFFKMFGPWNLLALASSFQWGPLYLGPDGRAFGQACAWFTFCGEEVSCLCILTALDVKMFCRE